MKRILLFCCILLSSISGISAQVKGCWMLEKEFVYLDDYDLKAHDKNHVISVRHYEPGSAVFTLTTSTRGSSANPPKVLMPGSYTPEEKAENERQWKEWEQASKGRTVVDEYEIDWRFNAPKMIYFGEEDSITASFEIKRNGQPSRNPVTYDNNGVLSFASGYMIAYSTGGVSFEGVDGVLTADQVEELLDCTYEELDDCMSELLDGDSIGATGLLVIKISLFDVDLFRETAALSDLFKWKAIILAVVLLILTRYVKPLKKLHPVVFILASAAAGIIFGF